MANVSTGADPATVGPHLARVLDDPAWVRCRVELIQGGKSNLTYLVTSDAGRVVLRRPPLGHTLPTAHDVTREHRVMAGLAASAVPVPAALHLCADRAVLGVPFLVMEHVPGPVARDGLPAGYADLPAQRRDVGQALVDTLVALHRTDPAAVGLADFGRPDGYLARQVARWARQWAATPAAPTPELDRLADTLGAHVPAATGGRIVHGDYRIDNVVLAPGGPGRIAAVLDWELSTLGDPLADLGLLLVYWAEPGDDARRRAAVPTGTATALDGFPSREEVVHRYALATGHDVDALGWYVALGFFKLAVIVAGVAARGRAGVMAGQGFDDVGRRVRPLVELGHQALRTGAAC